MGAIFFLPKARIFMFYPNTQSLLRRTAAAIAAIAASCFAAQVYAANIELRTPTNTLVGSCPYGSMSVTPAGDFTVSCNATGGGPPAPGPAGAFALSTSSLPLQVSTSGNLLVTRAGGITDAVTVGYAIASATNSCVTTSSGTVTFPDQNAASRQIPVTATGVIGTCTVTLTSVTAAGTTVATTGPTFSSTPATVNVTAAPRRDHR